MLGGINAQDDPTIRNPAAQGKCWNITEEDQNLMEGKMVFIYDAPPKPPQANVSRLQWLRIYTILFHQANGNDGQFDKWLTIRGLRQMHKQTFGEPMTLEGWMVNEEDELGEKLAPVCKIWRDCMHVVQVRLTGLGDEHDDDLTYAETDWGFRRLQGPMTPWKRDQYYLRLLFTSEYCTEKYLQEKLKVLTERFPMARLSWLVETRAQVYAMLVSHFPVGIDSTYFLSAFERMYGRNLSLDLNNQCNIETIVEFVIDDFIKYVPVSTVHANIYPMFCPVVGVPATIRKSLNLTRRLRDGQLFAMGTPVLMIENKLPRQCVDQNANNTEMPD